MDHDRTARVLLYDRHPGRDELRAGLVERGFSIVTAVSGADAVGVLSNGFRPEAVILGEAGVTSRAEAIGAIRQISPDIPVLVVSDEVDPEPLTGPQPPHVSRGATVSELEAEIWRLIGGRQVVSQGRSAGEVDDSPTTTRPEAVVRSIPGHSAKFASALGAPAGDADRCKGPDSGDGADVDDRFLVGYDPMRRIRNLVEQVADTDVPVLITGDSGVGKEVIARAIHESSDRADRPFVKVNCAALPEQLLESELFGYERGAFTGADRRRQGKFEIAEGGTIFLDEIGEIDGRTQAKLLQVLQDSHFFRLGGVREIRVDARVLASTNRDLESSLAAGEFRKDLFYRLNVIRIEVLCLSERREEVPLLAEHFLRRYQQEYGRFVGPLDDDFALGRRCSVTIGPEMSASSRIWCGAWSSSRTCRERSRGSNDRG